MKQIIFFLTAMLTVLISLAQTPQQMSYQAVIRNAANELVANKQVGIKISILKDSPSGSVVYAETHTASTNSNGLVNIIIGSGTVVTGSLASVEWKSGSYYIKTETDPSGGNNYNITGTSQLLSVPYALLAKSAEDVDDADADPNNEIQALSINENQLSLSKGGGTVTLPSSTGGTGIQGVQNSNNTLNITNPNGPTATIDLKLPFSASTTTTATTFAVANQSSGIGISGSSVQGDGIVGSSARESKSGIWGNNTGGGYGIAGSTSGSSTAGVWGSNSGSGFGLKGTSSTGAGIYGSTAGTGAAYGIAGESTANSGVGIGVYGRSASPTGTGVYGWANNASGVNYGVYGVTGSATGFGGYFEGRGYFSGNVGIGTTNPTGKLHVSDETGGNESVVLPDNSISAQEIQDEPGIATESSEDTYGFSQDNELITILSSMIHAPSDGFILAIASFQLYAIPEVEINVKFGISLNNTISDSPRRNFKSWKLSTSVLSFPVSFSNVFKVNSGYHMFHLLGMKTGGGQEVDVIAPQLTLIFLPTAYGLVRTFQ